MSIVNEEDKLPVEATSFFPQSIFGNVEILRYLNFLKTEESVERIVEKVIRQLVGKRTKGLNFVDPR
ncbi:MAG: hypothetical protein WBW71_13005 [Bacteroidota bacterium]